MKKVYLIGTLLASAFLSIGTVSAQTCISETMFQEAAAKNPALLQSRAAMEAATQQYIATHSANRTAADTTVRIIPVVFHILHEGGSENISKAQILDQIRILNLDFRGKNADTTLLPVAFRPLKADSRIEFRLAQKDPNGNCTDGIVRKFTHLTNNARDNVKSLSRWPTEKYLNVWVVKTIAGGGPGGIILGFAQFPQGGFATTDGVVLRGDIVGSIGTAQGTFNNKGRTATHEVGHWLNLRHIWGDADCGSDLVEDTPPAKEANAGCPAYPHVNTDCNTNPKGELVWNYMDYTDGACQNLFTWGQKERMDAVLAGFRAQLVSPANLAATGVDIVNPTLVCSPIADFLPKFRTICTTVPVQFTDNSYNGAPTTWSWSFPGGTPSSSTVQNPSVTYANPGTYDVTLTVSNATGTSTLTRNSFVNVEPLNSAWYNVPVTENFDNYTGSNPVGWVIQNDDGGIGWEKAHFGYSGNGSLGLRNFDNNPAGEVDAFISPNYNFSYLTGATLTFRMAYAQRDTSLADVFKVFSSTNCGATNAGWTQRYNKSGNDLAAGSGGFNDQFYDNPPASHWKLVSIPLTASSFNNKPSVRFKFEFTSAGGNNIYIDDINIIGTVGIEERDADALNFRVFPNPATNEAKISYLLTQENSVNVTVYDALGKKAAVLVDGKQNTGEYNYSINKETVSTLNPGMYTVTLRVGDVISTKRLIITQ
jgi:PKD repeat protein